MTELPAIDTVRVLRRETEKLKIMILEALHKEAQLEILVETLRDERDNAEEERDKAQNQLRTYFTDINEHPDTEAE